MATKVYAFGYEAILAADAATRVSSLFIESVTGPVAGTSDAVDVSAMFIEAATGPDAGVSDEVAVASMFIEVVTGPAIIVPYSVCDQLSKFIPLHKVDPAKPYLCAYGDTQSKIRDVADAMAGEMEPGTAEGIWLDQVGAGNYGINRVTGEIDTAYRARILAPAGQSVTDVNIEAGVNAILDANGLGTCLIVEWFEDNHFMDDPNEPNGLFADYDYMTLINGFTVHLPAATPTDVWTQIMFFVDDVRAAGCPFKILLTL